MMKTTNRVVRHVLKATAVLVFGAGVPVFGIEVQFQTLPMKITFAAEGKVLAEVKEIAIGAQVYNSIQSVQKAGAAYEVTFPDGKVLTISPVTNGVRVYFDPKTGSSDVTIKMNHLGGHFFGIRSRNINGNNPDVTGLTMAVGMDSGGGGEAWAGVFSSFFMNSRGYGSFFDTFYNGRYKLGVNGEIELMHRDCGVIDWYLFYGPTGEKIHEGLFSVVGKPKKVPMWACGPTIWRNDNTGSHEILADAGEYNALKIPVTHWWVDRPYSDGHNAWSKMNFKSSFSNPGKWIGKLDDQGIAFSTWTSPALFGVVPECPRQFSNDFGYIDLSDPAAYDWYKHRLRDLQYVYGVKGHKIDRVDEKFSFEEEWADGTPREARWNTYAYLSAKSAGEALAESHPDDHFLFARVAYNRVQPYLDAVWGGDVGATLAHMGNNICNAMRTSYMGFPIWGTDGGGYKSDDISDDQYIRWAQFCLYNGMFEYMIDNRLIWQKSKALQDAIREIHTRRMEMLPMIYSLANTADRTGVLMQPMAYRFPDDANVYSMWNQYFFGEALLVAPVYEDNSTSRDIYLPKGRWIDQQDYSVVYEGGQTITYEAPQNVIPVLIQENSIYPDGLIYDGNMRLWDEDFQQNRHLNINAFPGEPGSSSSFLYVDYLDQDAEKRITLNHSADGVITLGFPAMTVGGAMKVRLDQPPGSVALNGVNLSDVAYDANKNLLTVPYPASSPVLLTLDLRPSAGANRLPQFTSAPTVRHMETGKMFRYRPVAADTDQDAVTLQAVEKPAWLEFKNGELSGKPEHRDIGSHPVKLTASDGQSVVAQSFTLLVSAPGNDASVILSAPKTNVFALNSFRYTLNASDPDGDPLVCAAPVKPDWLELNGNVLSGTPFSADVGIHPVVLTVFDGQVTVTQQFNLTVSEMPKPDNLVQNESFEDGTTSWTIHSAEVGSTVSKDRNSSLAISKPSASARQTVPLQPGKTYALSVWIHAAGLKSGAVVFDTSDAYDETAQFVVSRANSCWTQFLGGFTATNSQVTLRLFSEDAFSGTVYYDGIVLTEAENIAK